MPFSPVRFHAFIDWDDTLKVTNAIYNSAGLVNAQEILDNLPTCSLNTAQVVARIHAIDLDKAHKFGLRPQNYPEAWVEGYRALAREFGVAKVPKLETSLYNRAHAVVFEPQENYPGAPELLQAIREMDGEITIWTAGDKAIQNAKVERAGFLPLVDRVCAVQDKSPQTLRDAIGTRNPAAVCVIGNSPRSDISPALSLGVLAIHVLQDTWAYDTVSIDANNPHYHAVHTLGEIPPIIRDVLLQSAAVQPA